MAITIPWLAKGNSKKGRVGLAVGPDGMAVVYLNASGSLQYCQFHDVDGDVGSTLAQLVVEQDWQDTPCSIVLHPLYYQLLLTERPPVEGDEMSSAIRWKVKELLDFPLEEAAIEYFLLPEDAYRGRQKMLYAAALRKKTLSSLVAPIEISGLAVDCVEVAELAMHNIVSRLPREGGGIAMVQLSESEGFINLVEDGAIYLTRRLDIGLDKFHPGADNSQFFEALLLDIQRSLDYYESQLGKGIITRLFYSPGLESTVAIGEFLSAQLGLNVAALDIKELGFAVLDEQVIKCSAALGAALGPSRKLEADRAAS
ncbi:MAG: MSHA biogenesis protein MshI [Oceanicoccus sp.]|jgi:MSHA biogenesis protein MshI